MVWDSLRTEVDYPINETMKHRQDMLAILDKTQVMHKHAGKVVATTHYDMLINHLQFKNRDIIRKVEAKESCSERC